MLHTPLGKEMAAAFDASALEKIQSAAELRARLLLSTAAENHKSMEEIAAFVGDAGKFRALALAIGMVLTREG